MNIVNIIDIDIIAAAVSLGGWGAGTVPCLCLLGTLWHVFPSVLFQVQLREGAVSPCRHLALLHAQFSRPAV